MSIVLFGPMVLFTFSRGEKYFHLIWGFHDDLSYEKNLCYENGVNYDGEIDCGSFYRQVGFIEVWRLRTLYSRNIFWANWGVFIEFQLKGNLSNLSYEKNLARKFMVIRLRSTHFFNSQIQNNAYLFTGIKYQKTPSWLLVPLMALFWKVSRGKEKRKPKSLPPFAFWACPSEILIFLRKCGREC